MISSPTEMDRLHHSCRRLVWLNPLLRFDGFEARARGDQGDAAACRRIPARPFAGGDRRPDALAVGPKWTATTDPKNWLKAMAA